MKNIFLKIARMCLLVSMLFVHSVTIYAAAPSITITPDTVIQGEPIKITFNGIDATSTLSKVTFEGKAVSVFLYKNKGADKAQVTAFVGIDLYKKSGTSTVSAILQDGSVISKDIFIGERPKLEAPLGIPEKLGGNTPAAATHLVSSLSTDNAVLNSLDTGKKAYWTKPFIFPLASTTVTDVYGYTRDTVGVTIAHKGTDFRAPEGTSVMAMNRGVVRLVKNFPSYGNTVVIDHGLGLMTLYMHLSKTLVQEGSLLQQGDIIAKSGNTGYAEGMHLHLSVRINNISIDPMKFMAFFK